MRVSLGAPLRAGEELPLRLSAGRTGQDRTGPDRIALIVSRPTHGARRPTHRPPSASPSHLSRSSRRGVARNFPRSPRPRVRCC